MSFRKLHVFARQDELGNVHKCFASITDSATNDTISAELAGDWRNESEAAVVEAVLEAFFKKHFADKAMAESVQKVDEMEKLLSRTRLEIAELKAEALAEIRAEAVKAQEESERNREMLKVAFMTINSLMVGADDDEEDLDDDEDSEDDLA